MNKHITTIAIAALALLSAVAEGQPLRSGYFLPGMLNRTKINPSVINKTGYVGIPVISDLSVGFSSNTGVANYIFPYAPGGLTTFMNSSVSASDFLSNLAPVNNMNVDFSTDLLSGGYFAGQSYQTVALTLRSMASATMPYALFDFMKSGMSSPTTQYLIKDLAFQTENFMELSWSYARAINAQWSVGGRAKLLMGLAQAEAKISEMQLDLSETEWRVESQGSMSASAIVPILFNVGENGTVSGIQPNTSKIAPSSFGFSFDFGVTYQPTDRWTLSLAATDVGLIWWGNSAVASTGNTPFSFKGFQNIPLGGGVSIGNQVEELKRQAMDLFAFYPASQGESNARWLKATVNVGAEYEILEDLFSIGILSSTRIDPVFTLAEVIVSANYRPSNSWFNASITGDFSNVAISCGAVVNFCPKFLNFFVGFDYMLLNVTPQFFPLSGSAPRVSFGLNVPLGGRNEYYKNRR